MQTFSTVSFNSSMCLASQINDNDLDGARTMITSSTTLAKANRDVAAHAAGISAQVRPTPCGLDSTRVKA